MERTAKSRMGSVMEPRRIAYGTAQANPAGAVAECLRTWRTS